MVNCFSILVPENVSTVHCVGHDTVDMNLGLWKVVASTRTGGCNVLEHPLILEGVLGLEAAQELKKRKKPNVTK